MSAPAPSSPPSPRRASGASTAVARDSNEKSDEKGEREKTERIEKSERATKERPARPTLSSSASLRRTVSPPVVSLFGGVSPDGIDALEGLAPVRSREEEMERQLAREEKGPDPWAVKLEQGEKLDPKNWSRTFRWYLTILGGVLVLNSTFASSAPSGITQDVMAHFHVSQEVAVLCISLFVAGYCVGPLLWGPLSESYGRRPIFVIAFIVYTGFQVGCALAPNTGSMLVFRFLSGTFAAAPLTNSGALLADIWDVDTRGSAMAFFGLAPFAGPSLGPIVSGYIQTAGADWRWVYWVTTIFAGVCTIVIIFTLPETYAPVIVKKKAQRMRKETGEERWYAPIERRPQDMKTRLREILLKPFIMLFTLYMSFVYGIVYLLFEAYPYVFVQNHGFNSGENGLAFLGFFIGGVLATIFYMTVIERRYQKVARRLAPAPVPPEKRLEMCAVTGWLLVIAMFWFGWTSYPSIHWISPVLAGGLIGVSALGMFLSLFNHIIDSYLWSAASALSACTVVRSAFGAGFPLFAGQMYARLGTQWASSLLGFIALVLAPVPLVLMKYGPQLRARSRFTPSV